jgi:hypothetical protein
MVKLFSNHPNVPGIDKAALGLLAISLAGQSIAEELIGPLKSLLSRPDITPEQVKHIGKLLFAVVRLPQSTPGVSVRQSDTVTKERGRNGLRYTAHL